MKLPTALLAPLFAVGVLRADPARNPIIQADFDWFRLRDKLPPK